VGARGPPQGRPLRYRAYPFVADFRKKRKGRHEGGPYDKDVAAGAYFFDPPNIR
jgi:hypothetical protein